MKPARLGMHLANFAVLTICLCAAGWALPQQRSASASSTTAPTVVPRLVSFAGVVKDSKGNPVTGSVDLTLSLYTFQEGGSPLWMETQKVQLDDQGHYTALLGSSQPEGLPLDLFTSGQAQWLGVQPELPGAVEQPRVLLVGMPYALKAADADTLGGMPPSAFAMVATAAASSTGSNSATSQSAQTESGAGSAPDLPNITGSGTAKTIPIFSGTTTIGNSLISQIIGAAVVSEILQLPATGTATSSQGFSAQPLDSLASAFNSSSHAAVNQHFRWQAEPTGNNTTSPSGKFNLLFASGTGTPAETGLSISSKGVLLFAAGQTFPGTGSGTVTSVGSGAGLSGGPITGSGTLSVATAGVTNAMLQHSSLTVTAGSGLSGGGTISLGGAATLNLASAACPAGSAAVALPLTCSPFATLGANNFSGNQTVTGNLSATNEVSAGSTPTGNVASGTVEVDAAAVNSGSWSPALTFGGGGEVIASNRTTFNNQYGLDFYTAYTPRMSVTNTGLIGIGVQSPSWMLEVDPPYDSRIFGAGLIGASDTGSGVGASYALYAAGGFDTSSVPFNSGGLGAFIFGGSSNVGYGGDGLDSWGGDGPLANGYAGYFQGDVHVAGNLSKSSGSFKIDHPLDPGGKYLYHSFVESPDMMNIYNGNVALDGSGEAVVELPEWFEALNKDYRYQLTCIGGFAPVYIAEEISNNRFRIAGGKAGMKVSWTVTGVRQDAWANAHRIPVEVDKPERERGYYIHPELFGAPAEQSIAWARHPEEMKRLKADREKRAKVAQNHKP